jgi:hypothetical protein
MNLSDFKRMEGVNGENDRADRGHELGVDRSLL